jgi:hypothetical protein
MKEISSSLIDLGERPTNITSPLESAALVLVQSILAGPTDCKSADSAASSADRPSPKQ